MHSELATGAPDTERRSQASSCVTRSAQRAGRNGSAVPELPADAGSPERIWRGRLRSARRGGCPLLRHTEVHPRPDRAGHRLIAVNAVAVGLRWDPYPFILLNLAFSTQAAYAAPLILLAQTRQVDRDKAASDQLEAHREEVAKRMQEREAALKAETDELKALLESNTQLTQQDKELTEKIEALTREIHAHLTGPRT